VTIAFDAGQELAFYTEHLTAVLLPFWLDRAPDQEHGGFFTCFDSVTGQLLSEDKFTWSQGRIVWVWARLAGMSIFAPDERDRFLDLARSGADFLMRHCLLPGDRCAFLMTRDGQPKPQAEGMPLDSSIYADCFVILGLARYAAVSGDRASLDFARRVYRSVMARLASDHFYTEPYPIPAGYKVHGIPMILLNTSQELAHGLAAHGLADEAAEVMRGGDGYLAEIRTRFVAPDGALHEMITSDNRFVADNLLGRYVNPGHTIEDLWFWIHQTQPNHVPDARVIARSVVCDEAISITSEIASLHPANPMPDSARNDSQVIFSQAAQIIKRAFEIGWDHEYGGLLLFADQDGGPPTGSVAGLEDERMAQKVQADWGSKLWWVHSEALYTTLLAWRLTGDAELLALYRRTFDYTFRTFPHPDGTIGEWIQIRDRQSRPEQRVVALPVKDPFHIIRNVAQIIDLLMQVPTDEKGES
jgi:N-acylglucosamine 2-epimerase